MTMVQGNSFCAGPRKTCMMAWAILSFLLIPAAGIFSESSDPPQPLPSGHQGTVNALAYLEKEDIILSVGSDGFLIAWSKGSAVHRFQLSPYNIISIAVRSGYPELAIGETDGLGVHRISVWNYQTRKRLFTLRLKDPLSYLTYSAAGTFLIAGRSARNGTVFIDPTDGTLLQSPAGLPGPLTYIATGRSERSMIAYATQGSLTYWDIVSDTEIKRLQLPFNLAHPLLFSNNRFFVGIDSSSLVLFDAVSGEQKARISARSTDRIVQSSVEGSNFYIVSEEGFISTVAVNPAGIPDRRYLSIPSVNGTVSAGLAFGTTIVIGTTQGKIRSIDANGGYVDFRAEEDRRILDAAVSGDTAALLSNEGLMVVPRDVKNIRDGSVFTISRTGAWDRIHGGNAVFDGSYILWRTDGIEMPVLWKNDREQYLGISSTGYPIRSLSRYGDGLLVLDIMGSLSIWSIAAGTRDFAYSSIGLMDAVFGDGRRVVVGRSAVASSAPLLAIDTNTGETVSLAYPAQAVVRLYRGHSGNLYGIAIHGAAASSATAGENTKTSVIKIESSAPPSIRSLVEYQGEDLSAAVSETYFTVATTLGGDGATLFNADGLTLLPRGDALPKRILDAGSSILVVDTDGAILWYDPESAGLLGTLQFNKDSWVLSLPDGSRRSGSIVRESGWEIGGSEY